MPMDIPSPAAQAQLRRDEDRRIWTWIGALALVGVIWAGSELEDTLTKQRDMWRGIWHHWVYLLPLAVPALCFREGERLSARAIGATLCAWVLASAAAFGWDPGYPWGAYQRAMDAVSGRAAGAFAITVALAVALRHSMRVWVLDALGLVALFDAGLILYRATQSAPPFAGLMGTATIDAAWLAFVWPALAWRDLPRGPGGLGGLLMSAARMLLPPAAILASGGAAGLWALLAGGAVLVLHYALARRRGEGFTPAAAGACAVVAAIPCAILAVAWAKGIDLLGSAGRTSIWRAVWDAGMEGGWFILGTGTGTAEWVIPLAQQKAGGLAVTGGAAIWLHNDWMQLALEQGLPGLALGLALFGMILWHSLRTPGAAWLSAALASAAVAMTVQMPIRHAPSALYLALLVMEGVLLCPRRAPPPKLPA